MSHTCIHTHAHKLSYPHCYCHTLHAHSLTHTFTHTHFFWMIKSEESDHTIMWEMCFSDIIEMGKKRFLKQQYQKAKFSISLIKFFFSLHSLAWMQKRNEWLMKITAKKFQYLFWHTCKEWQLCWDQRFIDVTSKKSSEFETRVSNCSWSFSTTKKIIT